MADPVIIEITEPAPQPVLVTITEGTGSASAGILRRHAHDAGVDYCGRAPTGSAEDAPVWTISRITVAADGSTTTATASEVPWSEHASALYS
jgi:hypothetical protein